MTDLDLERLGDVWRQQPGPAELDELRRTAEAGRRRAKLAQAVDVVAAVLVAAVVMFLVIRNPRLETLIVGGGAMLVLLMSQVRQRRLRALEIQSLTGGTEEMLDQAIARVEATLRRTRFQLVGFAPAFLLGIGVAYAADVEGLSQLFERIPAEPWARMALAGLFALLAAALGAMAWHLARLLRRSRQELERLVALRDAYRDEHDPHRQDFVPPAS